MNPRLVSVLLLLGGIVVVVGMSLVGQSEIFERVAQPPPFIRAGLIAVAVVVGWSLLRASVERFQAAGAAPGRLAEADPVVMLRGIRLVFLALAAFAAALGWLLANPVPLVVAAIVAAVDVIETSFLLLVVGPLRRRSEPD